LFKGKLQQWQEPFNPTTRKVTLLWLWFGVALGAGLIKPGGLELHRSVFATIGNTDFIYGITGEFLPTSWEAAFIPFWVLLGFTVAAMLINWRRVDVTHLFLLLPFVYLGLRYNRGVAVCAIVIAPLCVCSLQQLFQRPGLQSKAIKLCFLLAITAALCWTVYIKLPEKGTHLDPSGVRTGLGINRAFLPIGVTEYIKTANLQGNMFNTDRFGGLLSFYLYPERRIFHYNHPLLFRDIYEYLHNPGARDKWEHSYAIVAKPLEVKMFENKGWVRVYHDPAVMVLVDPRQTDRRIIEKYAIRYFNPLMSLDQARRYSRTPQFAREFLREVANYLQFNEDPRFCLILVEGVSGDHVGLDEQGKVSLLTAALDSNPDHDALLNNLGLLLLRQGNALAAKAPLERAQQLNFSRTGALNLGFVYLELRTFEQAAAVFDQLLKNDAKDADAIFGLALALRGQNRHQQALGLFEKYLQLAPQGRFAQRARGFISEK
ncbi:MAG: tetratricopeptide repeat protein, partial [Desulfuromonadales bacterium]|nr:tetratricopeptide repeat protein [Desulfuromonadales bacterium]